MRQFFCSLVAIFIFFGSLHASTDHTHHFNPKNYIYDDNGNPVFIRIYIDNIKTRSTHQHSFIETLMMQNDERGSYLAIPIKKKKSRDEEEEKTEEYWECPYCGTKNPPQRNTCMNRDCILNREGIRERQGW